MVQDDISERPCARLFAPEALVPGQRLIVSCDDPRALVAQLEAHPEMACGLLHERDGQHRFEVERVSPAVNLRIAAYVGWDQRRIDDLLEAVFDRFEQAQWEGAQAAYRDFMGALCRHMEWEETVLLPLVREDPSAPVGRVGDHPVIRGFGREALRALERGDGERFRRAIGALLEVNGAHEFAEEVELYPRLDRLLGPGRARALILEQLLRGSHSDAELHLHNR